MKPKLYYSEWPFNFPVWKLVLDLTPSITITLCVLKTGNAEPGDLQDQDELILYLEFDRNETWHIVEDSIFNNMAAIDKGEQKLLLSEGVGPKTVVTVSTSWIESVFGVDIISHYKGLLEAWDKLQEVVDFDWFAEPEGPPAPAPGI
jgi:hypothetical protein